MKITKRRTAATLAAGALVATPLAVLTATTASADIDKEREFRVAGADVDFSVEKDDGRYEVEVDLDDAPRGSKWRIVLRHDGTKIHDRVHRADGDGDIDVDRSRPDTRGDDRFKVVVKKVGGANRSAVITMP